MKDLETNNLILRKFKVEDAEKAYENWAGVEELACISDFRVHYNVQETREIIEYGLGDEGEDIFTWAVVLKETNEPIGFIRIYEIMPKNNTCKITWTLGYKWWNKGLSNEGLKEVFKYLFNEKDFNVIISEHYTDFGDFKGRILDEVGMTKEAVLRNRRINPVDGKVEDKIVYSILKEEFNK